VRAGDHSLCQIVCSLPGDPWMHATDDLRDFLAAERVDRVV
jgi:hypothetical protein